MLELFLIFMKICLTTFGGGSVMISLARKDFVETGVMKANDFLQSVAIAQSTPGPIAGSLATLVGYKLQGIGGIIAANVGVVLPSLIIIPLVINYLNKHKDSKPITNIMAILRPITIAIILSVLIFFIDSTVFNGAKITGIADLTGNFNIGSLLIILVSLFLSVRFKANPIYIIIISGILGAIII